ncbi:MAG: formylglycine-generating enzyme family protein [Prevotella sp.]|nr:formylglycine-generating enzyme family protein [Prevotella sp.]
MGIRLFILWGRIMNRYSILRSGLLLSMLVFTTSFFGCETPTQNPPDTQTEGTDTKEKDSGGDNTNPSNPQPGGAETTQPESPETTDEGNVDEQTETETEESGEISEESNEIETIPEFVYPEIIDFTFSIDFNDSRKLRQNYAVNGRSVGTMGNVEGGTEPFTFSLVDGNGNNDRDNSRFEIDDGKLNIKDASLSAGTYYINVGVTDNHGKTLSKTSTLTIYETPTLAQQEERSFSNINFKMRYVTPGKFRKNIFEVMEITKGYWIAETEMTQDLYVEIMGNNPSYYQNDVANGEVQGKRPMDSMTIKAAIMFCNRLSILSNREPVYQIDGITDWLTVSEASIPELNSSNLIIAQNADGYRLPTKNEWLYAVIGADLLNPGTTNEGGYLKRFSGDSENMDAGSAYAIINEWAWTSMNSDYKTHEVGKKRPNELGLLDMTGNVQEYTEDSCFDMMVRGGHSNRAYTECFYEEKFYFQSLRDIPTGFRLACNQ